MKVEFVTGHTHKGVRYNPGQILEVSSGELVKLVSRGVAQKVKTATFRSPAPETESDSKTSIGDTDGPATDK